MRRRSVFQNLKDSLTFPVRAFAFYGGIDRWGLSSLATERFDYVAREVRGHCLDVGCGRYNRFVNDFLDGNGKGIDVYPHEGLTEDNILDDPTRFPFPDESFDSVTFIATLNHVPSSLRDAELAEAYRCLKPGGNIAVTMGNPIAEVLVHKIIALHDRVRGTRFDIDAERGMHEDEALYLRDSEIRERLRRAGFEEIAKRYFWTQWGLNHLFVAWKRVPLGSSSQERRSPRASPRFRSGASCAYKRGPRHQGVGHARRTLEVPGLRGDVSGLRGQRKKGAHCGSSRCSRRGTG
jgi:SAM-dependent methyltransferase